MKSEPLLPSRVTVAKRYGYWSELLHEWLFLMERVNRLTKGAHAAYGHKERTNVGLFAAAATANGWAALVECRSSKVSKDQESGFYEGRTDLMLWRGRRFHEIEAKFLRVPLTSRIHEKRLETSSEKALADAARSTQALRKSDRTLAINFVVPTLSEKQSLAMSREEKTALVKGFVNLIVDKNPEFYAYTFLQDVVAVGSKEKGRRALGIILFGNEPSEV